MFVLVGALAAWIGALETARIFPLRQVAQGL
jgi:hypothetical protein